MQEFISSEITHGILDLTPVTFGTITEGILEILDDRLETFRANFVAWKLEGAHRGLKACGALYYFREEDPITISCYEELKVDYASCLHGDQFHDWMPLRFLSFMRKVTRNQWSCHWQTGHQIQGSDIGHSGS